MRRVYLFKNDAGLIKVAILMAFLFLLSAFAASYPSKWGPFKEGESPPLFPVEECINVEDVFCRDEWRLQRVYSAPGEADNLLLKVDAGPEGMLIAVEDKDKGLVFGPEKVSSGNFGNSMLHPPVLSGDLNGDGIQDFILPFWYGGCGLASGNYKIVFLLSDGDSYNITVFDDMVFSRESFVNINGKCRYVHTSFVFGKGEPSRLDGRERNFWVYNLLGIEGSKIATNNEADRRFPAWIWFTYGPNHKNTVHLTDEQKERLWDEHVRRSPVSRQFMLRF